MSLLYRLRAPGPLVVVIVVFLFVCSAIAVNTVAYVHASAMIHFSNSGARTDSPEELSVLSKIKILLTGINLPRPQNSLTPADIGLSFETHQFRGSDNHTLEAWYIPSTNKDTLILLFHGYADSKDTLLPVAKAFHDIGHSTLLVDFFGSGGSNGNNTTIGYKESQDVSQSYLYARQQWAHSTIVLYGYSMGGAAVLRSVAIEGTDPDAIVIEATYDTMLNTVKNRFTSMGVPHTPFAHLLVFWGGRQAGFNAFTHNPADYASSVTRPTLVIHGAKDPRVSAQQAATVYRHLGGWRKLTTYKAAGHKPVLYQPPDRTGSATVEYNDNMTDQLSRWREDIKTLLSQTGSE